MVCTRTVRKPSQYAFEGSREALSSDDLSGSSHWVTTGSSTQPGESVQLLTPRNTLNYYGQKQRRSHHCYTRMHRMQNSNCCWKRSPGVSRYTTTKNRRNNPERLELMKFCPQLNRMNSSSRNKIEKNIILAKRQTPNKLVSNKNWLSKHGRVHAFSNAFWAKNRQREPHIDQRIKRNTESSLINTNQSIQTSISRI